MPNIWTHFIFGQECLKALNKETRLTAHEKDQRLFNLGCQGPDFLFYHQFLPWQSNKTMNQLGSAMHKQECGPTLQYMIEQALREEQASPLLVYVCGFVTHHVLDRHMHPYVFYKSGFRPWDHQRFEVILDTLVAKQLRGLETWRLPVWKEIYVGKSLPNPLISLFDELAEWFYPDIKSNIDRSFWNASYQDMIKAQKIFHDPSGVKRILTFNKIEPLVYKRKNQELDYMNLQKEAWNHPCSDQEVYSHSFWNLWDHAMEDATEILSDIIQAFESKQRSTDLSEALKQRIGNFSYETGKPCEYIEEMNYVKPLPL
jgi:hypothetical protein